MWRRPNNLMVNNISCRLEFPYLCPKGTWVYVIKNMTLIETGFVFHIQYATFNIKTRAEFQGPVLKA